MSNLSKQKSTADLYEKMLSGQTPNKEDLCPEPRMYMQSLLNKYNYSASMVSDITCISKTRVCSFFDMTKNEMPQRNQIILMMLAIGATLEETNNALKYSIEKELYPKNASDIPIIQFMLSTAYINSSLCHTKSLLKKNGLWRISSMNDILNANNFPLLNQKYI